MVLRTMRRFVTLGALGLALVARPSLAQEHSAEIVLNDAETGAPDVKTIFVNKDFKTIVSITWGEIPPDGSNTLTWVTTVNGEEQASGTETIDPTAPLEEINAGTIKVGDGGTKTVAVEFTLDSTSATVSRNYQAYGAGASLVPLIVILILAVTTAMVELSLTTGIFVGACMVAGNINGGFKLTLEKYILGALADEGHAYVYLFTLFLAGLVAMMEKSGGIQGLTKYLAKIAKTPRTGLLAAFFSGCLIFFDDYANCLVIGQTMLPILDSLYVSREKLAFVVDATAAPIASLVPISSWVGFEVGLIQEELDRIVERGYPLNGIEASGYGVFLESIRFRYYPIFMLFLQILLILTARDFSFMLIAERRTQVYGRTDGGHGRAKSAETLSSGNAPKEETPGRAYNMLIPVALLIFFIFYLLVQSGTVEGEDQTFNDKIQGSDSYVALLWGTMATALCTGIMYIIQYVKDDSIVFPPILGWFNKYIRRTGEDTPSALMSLKECVESFLFGFSKIFPALIVLTLAWASGAVMGDVGTDRLFSSWIVGGVNPSSLPTLSFIISLLIATALGSSWGTMAVLFPLITVPTFEASDGNATIFYATVAGILSGSVAGDHMSPISDTTVLSALAAQCDLFRHVMTQAPYVGLVVLWSILVGTLPVGRNTYSTGVAIFMGFLMTVVTCLLIAVPVLSRTGRFGPIQELMMRFDKNSPLHPLKKHTTLCYSRGGEPISPDEDAEPEDMPEEGYRQSIFGRWQGLSQRPSTAWRGLSIRKSTAKGIHVKPDMNEEDSDKEAQIEKSNEPSEEEDVQDEKMDSPPDKDFADEELAAAGFE